MAKQPHMDTAKQKSKPATKPGAGMQAKAHDSSMAAPGKSAAKGKMNKSESGNK